MNKIGFLSGHLSRKTDGKMLFSPKLISLVNIELELMEWKPSIIPNSITIFGGAVATANERQNRDFSFCLRF